MRPKKFDVPVTPEQRLRIDRMVRAANSYAKRRGVPGKLDSNDVARLLHYAGWRCIYCGSLDQPDAGRGGRLLSIDHMRPISRNGINDIGNLLPCCDQCNKKKDMKRFYVWVLVYLPISTGEFVFRFNTLRSYMGLPGIPTSSLDLAETIQKM